MGAPNFASGVAMRRSQHAVMLKPPPTAKPWICAITGLATLLEPGRPGRAVALVREAVLGGLEDLELADIGARDERLAARAAQHEDADGVVGVHLLARLGEALVHGPGHRIPGLGRLKVRVSTGPSRVMSASVVSTSNLLGRRVVAGRIPLHGRPGACRSNPAKSLSEKPG